MDVRPYQAGIRNQLLLAAQAGGDEARAVAESLIGPLDAAVRLALLDALLAAAEEITLGLAPGSVELRLRGRDVKFVVRPAAVPDRTAGDEVVSASTDGAGGEMTRINLRMPHRLKSRVELAAVGEGLSVNAWLVRAAAAALERAESGLRKERGVQRYTGWAR